MEKIPTKLIVAAAMVDRERRVLVQQRPAGKPMAGLWEFPGGKAEPGEAPETALTRELAEELGIAVDGASLTPATFASVPGMLLLLYVLREWRGEPRPLHAVALQWVRPSQMLTLAMPPADRPLIGILDVLIYDQPVR